MEDFTGNLLEWLNVAARWIHVFAGIMWVGQTYFFTWLDGRFSEMVDKVAAGSSEDRVWMVHSGGFYLVEKQKAPVFIPNTLHWFKWEAVSTGLSGLLLLGLVYYHGGLMANENGDSTVNIIIGIASIFIPFQIYDVLWNSRIGQNEKLAATISYVLLVGMTILLTQLMEGRAAYMHVGAMLGVTMVANVMRRIIPAQESMVAALKEGKAPDMTLALRAKLRSKHNTYLAVPVVFIMISNHYPVTSYGDSWNWAILSLLILVGWGAAKVIRRA
jgi:uncharacterized membrane protein